MHNFEDILWEESSLNLMTKLWCKFIINPILNHKLSKFMKLVKIDVVQVFGLVEDKHIFSTMSFMKSRLRNQLNAHLDFCTHFFNMWFFTL